MSAEFAYAQVSMVGMRVEEDSDDQLRAIAMYIAIATQKRVSIIMVKDGYLCVTMVVLCIIDCNK